MSEIQKHDDGCQLRASGEDQTHPTVVPVVVRPLVTALQWIIGAVMTALAFNTGAVAATMFLIQFVAEYILVRLEHR